MQAIGRAVKIRDKRKQRNEKESEMP